MKHFSGFPFSALIGQADLKRSLILNAINPKIGGVLIRGEKGTAKSTAVRALADILPEINVAVGCPYSCDPESTDGICEHCMTAFGPRDSIRRRQKVVTLPLNASEDRVIGGIDFQLAVKKGQRIYKPGVLADANRGILYVDEVNLLDDHIVDIILDAAASGENRIEREGVSFCHPSGFLLVGTMNPEEGDLRPQLLDRFGFCVEVSSEKEPEERILLMESREAFDRDPQKFVKGFESENQGLKEKIRSAQTLLPTVRFSKISRSFVSELCAENHVAGHRADLIIEQAAKAHAAWFQRQEATIEDIQKTAPFALLHRKRDASPPPPPPPPDMNEETPDPSDAEDQNEQNEAQKEEDQNPQQHPQNRNDQEETSPPPTPEKDQEENPQEEQNLQDTALEHIFDIGETFKVKKIVAPKDRIFRRGSGRRSRTRVSQKQGRYVKSAMKSTRRNTAPDIALDATLRAAAPYQISRAHEKSGLAVCLRPEDIREKIREKRIGSFLLFLVDASGSMGARGRMTASKGAVMSLLLDAYQKRDKVAMISFRREDAFVNLPPTSSVELAATLLKEMPVGGRTPLSAGLAKSYEMTRNYLIREPSGRPIVIIITDGKSNVAMGTQKPMDEALLFASRMGADERVQYIVVDTEQDGMVQFKLAGKLAAAAGAAYLKIDDLKADTLLSIAKGEL